LGWKKLEEYWNYRRETLLERLSKASLDEVTVIQAKIAAIDEFLRSPYLLRDRNFPFSVTLEGQKTAKIGPKTSIFARLLATFRR
jgi:hypothetical protein